MIVVGYVMTRRRLDQTAHIVIEITPHQRSTSPPVMAVPSICIAIDPKASPTARVALASPVFGKMKLYQLMSKDKRWFGSKHRQCAPTLMAKNQIPRPHRQMPTAFPKILNTIVTTWSLPNASGGIALDAILPNLIMPLAVKADGPTDMNILGKRD